MDIDEFLDKESELIENEPLEEFIPEEEAEKRTEGYKEILKKINRCISKNDFTEIEKHYSALWVKVGDEKYTWKKDLYDSLIELNKKLKSMLNSLSHETKEKISNIRNLIAKAEDSLKQGRIEPALSIHSEIINIYNKIPSAFEGEKKKVYMGHITPFNNELRKQVDKNFLHNFDSGLSKINHLISSVEAEMQKGNVEQAAKFYTDCIHSYNSLPNGFFLQKLEKSNKLLELYKELAITLEISDLKSKLSIIPVKEDYKVRAKKIKRHEQESDKNHSHMASLKKEIKSLSSKLKEQKEDYEQELAHEDEEQEDEIKKLTADYEKKRLGLNRIFKERIKEKDRRFDHILHDKEDSFKARIAQKEKEIKEAEEKAKKEKDYFRKPDPKPALITPPHIHKKPPRIRPPHIETPKPMHFEMPKRPRPPEKHSRLSTLEEELLKRKLERAQFEINRGYTKEADKDLRAALKIDADNKKARELLESLDIAETPRGGKILKKGNSREQNKKTSKSNTE